MRTVCGSFILLLFILLSQLGQAQSIEWQRNLGGDTVDFGRSIQETSDGGYIIFGESLSANGDVSSNHGSYDYWACKLDPSGNLEWEENYGGSDMERGYSVQETSDGGYILAGESSSSDGEVSGNQGGEDCWVVKLNPNGAIEWEENYGGTGDDGARSIQETSSGGYIVAGSSKSANGDVSGNNGGDDYWLLKLDGSGNIDWEENYGGSGDERLESVLETSDGYVMAGRTISNDGDVSSNNGFADYWVVKVDHSGNIIWEENFGGTALEHARSIQETPDGGYVVGGRAFSSDGDVSENKGQGDYWLVKLDDSGALQWEKSFGGSTDETCYSIEVTSFGNLVLAGGTNSTDGDIPSDQGGRDVWVLKLDPSGNILWNRTYGGSDTEIAWSIDQVSDGFVFAGFSKSSDGDLTGNKGDFDYWVVKLNGNGTSIAEQKQKGEFSVHPNPFKHSFTVKLQGHYSRMNVILRDLQGKEVWQERADDQQRIRASLDIDPGIYFLEIRTNEGIFTRKLIKE